MEKSIDQRLIDHANEHCKDNFNYPDYDPEDPITELADALTIIIHEHLPLTLITDSSELYDFFKESLVSKAGVHTPSRTTKVLARIREEVSEDFVDCSWKNDMLDSISIPMPEGGDDGRILHIYIPNSDKTDRDKELCGEYTVSIGEYADPETEVMLDSLDDVIEYSKKALGIGDLYVDEGHKDGEKIYTEKEALNVIKDILKGDKELLRGRDVNKMANYDLLSIGANFYTIHLK